MIVAASTHAYIHFAHTELLYALGDYENWPQHWLRIIIPASASIVTPKENEHDDIMSGITCRLIVSTATEAV